MSQFSRETAIARLDDGLWRGELHSSWCIGTVPNGGYVLAVAGRVLREALPHKDPLTVNAFYLAPTAPGPIDCRVELLRAGRNTSQAEVKMYQGGELKVQVTAAYTSLDTLQGASWSLHERPRYPQWNECQLNINKAVEFRQRVEIRFIDDPDIFRGGKPDGSGEFRGWAQLRDGAAPDVISLLMFADAFPPPAFSVYGPVGWVPTIELSVQVRAQPAPGPLQVHLRSRHLTRGIVEEDGEYWDSAGKLVAISRQSAKLRL